MSVVDSGNFTFSDTPILGVRLIGTKRFPDVRGYFQESYKRPDFEAAGIKDDFVQENQAVSVRGAMRGLHYQKRHPQSKLVRVLSGAAFDVAVDLRPGSPTFGRWHGELLSEDNGMQLYLPHGCAHGILALTDRVVFSYKSDDVYHPEDEGGLLWSDPSLAISWPMDAGDVIVSTKDGALPGFDDVFGTRA